MPESLSGVIERVTFHNLDTGFAVLRVLAGERRGIVTVVGHLPSAVAGEFIEAEGAWVQSRDHGMQFKADALRTTPPGTAEGMVRYLGSGLVKGIGPHFAKKIVEVFGERTLAVIDESPAFLSEVKGIGAKRIKRIKQSWDEQKHVRAIMVFLQSYGIGTARAVRIYKTYGEQAIDTVRANPYRLATDIWGVGFQTADQLALNLGLDRNSPLRAQAAVRYVLQKFSSEGHVGCPEEAVIQEAGQATQIVREVIEAAIETARAADEVVRDTPFLAGGGRKNPSPDPSPKRGGEQAGVTSTAGGVMLPSPSASGGEGLGVRGVAPSDESWLFLKPLFLAEVGVARLVRQLRDGPHPLPAVDVAAALGWVEQKMKLTLADTQRAAIRAATTEKVMVLTGGPGTGKSTIVRGILEVFSAKGLRCTLCAPTGRAAKRLGEVTGRDARTIHRLLEFDPSLGRFRRDRETPLDLDLLVVDEASMVDVVLMNQLLRAVPAKACVVLVGDVDQLPSVGPGTVLADLIASGAVPVVRLTEIFRQAGQSWIVRAAHAVNHGDEPESAPAGGDFFFVEANTPESVLERILTMVRERIPQRFGLDPLRDVQILSPMNRSELGVNALNERLQGVLNAPAGQKEVERFGTKFRVGDKVMQTSNNYQKEVFNGDIGRVKSVEAVDQEVLVEFEGRAVSYDFGELDELALAYAVTIHKAQGAEYPVVVIPVHTQHYIMLQRNLLYTGITRGKRLVVLVGSRKALSIAVQRQDTARRFTLLKQRLQQPEVKD
ncbi:MAG: AAA family ATPase [Gemmataceae bacterium]